jgi:hypothetical protein
VHAFNPDTKERKGFITHYKTYGITILKKYVDSDHAIIIKKLRKKKCFSKRTIQKTTSKKTNVLSKFYCIKEPLNQDNE